MVAYMHTVNPALEDSVAYQLADAILVNEAKHGIPIKLQLALVYVESRFVQYAESRVGAQGFWQVMPDVHADKVTRMFSQAEVPSSDLFNPYTNSFVGAKVLVDCYKQYKGNESKALLCYNGSVHDKERIYTKLIRNAKKRVMLETS